MISNIGEYCVNIQKTNLPREYRFYAVPTQGANLSNRSGSVWADSDEEAEQEVRELILSNRVFGSESFKADGVDPNVCRKCGGKEFYANEQQTCVACGTRQRE